ncbi:MAG: FadR family transcriptional regulator [Oscillospiraceae bacterium]|nr:FadR family transcriptional regulator [Oscillospiraceae bacterium]
MDSIFKTVQQHKELSLSERVAEQISDLIKEQNIGVGDKLPNEFELAERLNVGRGTIREAVKLLVARNCLEIRRGKGTFVTEKIGQVNDPLGFEYITDKIKLAEELYEVRVHLEPWIASLAAKRIQEDEKQELRQRCEAVEEKISNGLDHCLEDIAFHHYIASCTHNNVLSELLSIVTYSVQIFTRFKDPDMLQSTVELHRATMEAICSNDTKGAKANMLKHIESNLENIERLKAKQTSEI